MHGRNFIADDLENIVTRIRVILTAAIEGEPLRAFPAECLGVYAPLCLEPFVQRAFLPGSPGHFLLAGSARRERQTIVLEYLVTHVGFVGEACRKRRVIEFASY